MGMTLRIYERGNSGNWMTSKRLLPGSLVILSGDDFKNYEFFLVSDRNQK